MRSKVKKVLNEIVSEVRLLLEDGGLLKKSPQTREKERQKVKDLEKKLEKALEKEGQDRSKPKN